MKRFGVLLLFCFALVGAWYTLTAFIGPQAEKYVRRNLPEELETREVSFQLLPFAIELERPTVRTDRGRSARFDSIKVNPSAGSLFSDTVVIDTLEFDGIQLDFYRENDPGTQPVTGSEIAALVQSDGPSGQFRINRIRITEGKIRLLDNPADGTVLVDLSPVEITGGPVTPTSLRRGITVNATSGLAGRGERVRVSAEAKYAEELSVRGQIELKEIPPDLLHPEMIPGIHVIDGHLDGSTTFDYGHESLRISSLKLKFTDSNLVFQGSTPIPARDERTDILPEGPDTTDAFRTNIEDIQVELAETTVNLPPVAERSFRITEGLIKAGPYDSASPTLPVLGQLLLTDPGGLFEFRTGLDLSQKNWKALNFLSDFRVDNVSDLGPYFGNLIPVRLSAGTLQGGMKGSFSNDNLDLAFDLDFDRLKLRKGKTSDATFLGVPVNIYLNYLSKNDGQLELSFRLTGSPEAPTVDISKIRSRLVANLGIDVAIITALGLPVFVGDKVMQRVTGLSIIHEAKNAISRFFVPPEDADDPPTIKSDRPRTVIPEKSSK